MKQPNFRYFIALKPSEIQETSTSSWPKILKIGLFLTSVVHLDATLAQETNKSTANPLCHFMPSPGLPEQASREGISGEVYAKFTVVGGDVRDISIERGPQVFHASVIDALQRYKCSISDTPVRTGQSFKFEPRSTSKRRVILLADGRQYHGEASYDGVLSIPEGQGIEYESSGKIRRQGIWKGGELIEQREVNQYLYRFFPPPQKPTPPPPPPTPSQN